MAADLVAGVLGGLWLFWPALVARWVTGPARSRSRWLSYRRRWQPVLTIAGLAPTYRGQVLVPALAAVQVAGCTDRITVRLVSGQAPDDFADKAGALAHGSGRSSCRP